MTTAPGDTMAEQAIPISGRRKKEPKAVRPNHRPRGSGGTTVRLAIPGPGQSSGRLFIGRSLWQAIGEPPRVKLDRFGARLAISPAVAPEGYAVQGAKFNGQPRLSVGVSAMEQIALDPGVYAAHVVEGKQTIRVDDVTLPEP